MAWLRPDDQSLIDFLVKGEGNCPFIYLDSRGFPTYGVGTLIYRTDKGDPDIGLATFINLCNSAKIKFFRDKTRKGSPVQDDEIKTTVRNLVDIGRKKVSEFEHKRDLAFEQLQAKNAVSSASPPSPATPVKKNFDSSSLQDYLAAEKTASAAEKKAVDRYKNMGANQFWSKQPTLYTDSNSPLLLVEIKVRGFINELQKQDAWAQKVVGDLPIPIQLIVIDIVYNMGVANWGKFSWCHKVRDKIDAKDYEGLAKVILANIDETGVNGNTGARARKRATKVRNYAADVKGLKMGLGNKTAIA